MARREDEHLFACRFADRGNNKSVFYSRAHGEDRPPTRRVADRGSGGVYPDPRDLEEIRRLRQRVRDLEEIKRLRQRVQDLEKIERLQKRVRDLELQRDMCTAETESSTIVWDEGGDEEQHPFGYHPPWFYEPINQNCLSEDTPRFDEDEFDFDEDEYLFVEQAISGVLDGDVFKVLDGSVAPAGSYNPSMDQGPKDKGTDLYNRSTPIDIPLESATDLKKKEKELQNKEVDFRKREEILKLQDREVDIKVCIVMEQMRRLLHVCEQLVTFADVPFDPGGFA